MKKLMKAIAFVTVMCLALSTVAFAAGTATDANYDKIVDITVTGAGTTDQVALVVTAAGAEDLSNPLYIDQKPAVGGEAAFTAVLTNANVDEVDVWVGYATYADANGKAEKIASNVAITNPITEVTIAKVDTDFVTAEGLQQMGVGAALTVNVAAPDGVYATNMIWAIRFINAEGNEVVKYTESFDISDLRLGSAISGNVKLGLAFLNGFKRAGEEIEAVEITDVDAIFVFTNDEVEFTNDEDAANEK